MVRPAQVSRPTSPITKPTTRAMATARSSRTPLSLPAQSGGEGGGDASCAAVYGTLGRPLLHAVLSAEEKRRQAAEEKPTAAKSAMSETGSGSPTIGQSVRRK